MFSLCPQLSAPCLLGMINYIEFSFWGIGISPLIELLKLV